GPASARGGSARLLVDPALPRVGVAAEVLAGDAAQVAEREVGGRAAAAQRRAQDLGRLAPLLCRRPGRAARGRLGAQALQPGEQLLERIGKALPLERLHRDVDAE